jgi:hypothetical protein
MSVLTPGAITDTPTSEQEHAVPFFSAGTSIGSRAGFNNWNLKAFTWGAFKNTSTVVTDLGSKQVLGELRGDGSIISYGGRIKGFRNKGTPQQEFPSTSGTIVWNPYANGSGVLEVRFADNASGSAVTVDIAAYNANLQAGDAITVFVTFVNVTAASRANSIIWPSSFAFSGDDGDITPHFISTRVPLYKFEGVYSALATKFIMTRTDYEI